MELIKEYVYRRSLMVNLSRKLKTNIRELLNDIEDTSNEAGSSSSTSCKVFGQSSQSLRKEVQDDYYGGEAGGSCGAGAVLDESGGDDARGILRKRLYDFSKSPIRYEDMIKINVNVGRNSYKCAQCEYATSDIRKIKRHLNTHKTDKPFKCELCEYSTSYLRNLKTHMRTHTGDKPYKCEQCKYSACHLSTLKLHIRTHTGDKPYHCEQCDFSASRLDIVKSHMYCHTEDKPYKCELCDYSSSQPYNLKLHMRTHTGDKPYKCDLCEYRASRVDARVRAIGSYPHLHPQQGVYRRPTTTTMNVPFQLGAASDVPWRAENTSELRSSRK
ncbi:Zinc finger protein 227 [Eumeta japonica]|uniref:Zinc finger protein 227 n=1 Tax=Eumeta variegata TaxID=151549 RepID=A0A4C1Z385_EUMVA|nr:Zinc finger protein 227 [Eumeta japonica]